MQNKTYPVAEEFHSIQGEGFWSGTPMKFIRLAGCSVGRAQPGPFHAGTMYLKTGEKAWKCHTYDNRPFWCDTDFNTKYTKTAEELLSDVYENHVCLTGGEPLIHNLAPFIQTCDKMIHIETSGTIPFDFIDEWGHLDVWVTVSPKAGVLNECLMNADEIKLLVDENFREIPLPSHARVYVQPINNETSLNPDNVKLCLELLKTHPNWQLSLQIHKVIGVR